MAMDPVAKATAYKKSGCGLFNASERKRLHEKQPNWALLATIRVVMVLFAMTAMLLFCLSISWNLTLHYGSDTRTGGDGLIAVSIYK
jgi:hypothetical protein